MSNSVEALPSLLSLKKQLQDLGINTSTNGLMGDDRYEELHNRLLKAKGLLSDKLSSSSNKYNNVPESPLTQLTIGDIRSRLADLGESTSTPGLVGEERRTELLRRLTTAICGSDTDQSNAILDDIIDRKMKLQDEKIEIISIKAPDPPAPIDNINDNINNNNENNNENQINNLDATITNGDISEIKKILKRILNKRAIAVAARLSGTNQDPDLKEHEKNTSKVEAELARLRVQKANSTNIQTSSILIDGGVKMPVDRLMQRLENLKSESKEQIRIIRLKIRDEVDQHPEYGTAAEEELQAALRNANYTKGRTRRKIDEIKAMNSSKSSTSKGNSEIVDKSDDKLKLTQQKDLAPSKSKTILPPTKAKSMENGLDSRWDNLEALGDRQKREFEELMADLGHEEDLFDLKELGDDTLRPKTPVKNATQQESKSSKNIINSNAVPLPKDSPFTNYNATKSFSNKEKLQSVPPINNKIIDHYDDGNDDIEKDDDEEDSDEDEDDESVTHYSPPPTAPQVLKEKPSLIKRLLEEQEKERQSVLAKRNELNINYSNDDDDDDNNNNKVIDDSKNSYENSDFKYISNIYENLQSVPYTAPGTPKLTINSNEKDTVSNRAEEKSPRFESNTSSTKMISPVDTKPTSILERRKPPPPNQPPTNRPLESPTNKTINKPNLSVDTNLHSRPVTAIETVSRPQSAPSTPKTPMGSKAAIISKEDADLKIKVSPNVVPKRHDSDSDDNDEDDDDDVEGDDKKQVRSLLKHAKVLEGLGDLVSAESMYSRALELNPLDISSLNSYAVFLHNKRGELTRAESFFGRAIHVLFPSLYESVCVPNHDKIPKPPPLFDINENKSNGREDKPADTGTKYKVVVNSLLNFAGFLSRAKGDIESAQIVYSKALQIGSNDSKVLGIVGHFLSEEGGNSKKAAEIFAKAMKIDPNNAKHAMWYAKVLKKQQKYGQAELMYMVAMQKSQDDKKIEPTAICNYATYIFKHKKDKVKAQQMFIDALEKYPGHKGLVKNYSALLKANPHMGSSESLRQPTPMSAKSRLRVDSAIKAAMERINSPLVSAPGSSNLTRVNSSSAFTFMATELDNSRITSPDIVELKKIVDRKLTPHSTTRKKALKSLHNHDDDDDDDNDDINVKRMVLDSEKVVVEHSLDDLKDSWMKDNLFNNSSGYDDHDDDNEEEDDDDDDLYGAPKSPFKK